MAGVDFEFTYTDAQRPYVEACIRTCKVRAHLLRCRWRNTSRGDRRMLCRIDGQTRRLDLLGAVLTSDLQYVCEGVAGSLPPRRAAALGRGFAELFLVGRDVASDLRVQVLREVADTSLYFPVYEFADKRLSSENLRARLRVTEDVVTSFGLGRFERVVVMEELHTAIEQTMRELLPDEHPRANWPTLVGAADTAGLLDWDRMSLAVAHRHTTQDLLLEDGINQRRNAAKHRDGDPDDPWITEHWECLSLLLEHLVDEVARRDASPVSVPLAPELASGDR